MKRFFAIFVLTAREQRLVIFIMVALVVGAWIKHYRDVKINEAPKTESSSPLLVSPTPGEQ